MDALGDYQEDGRAVYDPALTFREEIDEAVQDGAVHIASPVRKARGYCPKCSVRYTASNEKTEQGICELCLEEEMRH